MFKKVLLGTFEFGDVYGYEDHTGLWHAINFSITAKSLEDLRTRLHDYVAKPAETQESDVLYQAQYAYACGYFD